MDLQPLIFSIFTNDTPALALKAAGCAMRLSAALPDCGVDGGGLYTVGILAGVYLTEYGDTSKLRSSPGSLPTSCCQPSIVLGLFVYAIAVSIGPFFGLYAGQFGLVTHCHSGGDAHHRKHDATGTWQLA